MKATSHLVTRRRFLAGLGMASLGVVTAACAQQTPASPTTAPASQPTAAAAGKPATTGQPTTAPQAAVKPAASKEMQLRYAMWGDDTLLERERNELIARFEEKNPAIKVKPEVAPFAQYWQRIQTEAAGGTPPDIMWMSVAYAWDFAHRKFTLNLQPLIDRDLKRDDYFYGVSATLRYPRVDQGDLYAFPHRWVCSVLFYNKKLFDEAGVKYPTDDWTYQDVLTATQKLTKLTGDPQTTVWGIHSHHAHTYLDALINAHGGEVLNKDFSKAMLDQPKAIEAIQWAADLVVQHKASPDPTVVQGLGPVFPTGRIAMLIDGSYNIESFKKIESFQWDIALVPKGPAARVIYGGPDSYSITNASKARDEAWEFLRFAVGPNRPLASYPGGTVPIYKPLSFSDEWLKLATQPGIRYKEAVLGAEQYVKGADFSSKWTEWRVTTMNQELTPAFLGQKSVKEAAESATKAIDQIIQAK